MRALVYNSFGNPREVLAVEQRPVPEPGPGQIQLELVLSPIHNHDLSTIRGTYGVRPPLPATGGTEALGKIAKLGPDVTQLAVGQRVCVVSQGAWGEYLLARAETAAPVPPSIPDESACQLLAMPLSAYLLLDELALQPGDWIIQNAANGAVGRIVDILARQREVNVVNLVRRQSTADELAAEGMTHLLATDDPQWGAQVPRLTGGAPVVRAVDSVGGVTANQLLDVLAPGGTLVSFGVMSGQAMVIDARQLIFKNKVVKGFWASGRSDRGGRADRMRMFGDLVRMVAAGVLPLRVAASFPFTRAAEAVAACETAGRAGKIALAPG